MFFLLHRLYVAGWIVLWVGGAIWAYPRSGLAEPASVWYEVWQNSKGASTRELEQGSGTVIKVNDATSFTLRTTDRQLYSIGLVGLAAPPMKPKPTPEEIQEAKQRKVHLSELVLSNTVDVRIVSLDQQHRGLGIVRIGATNINAALIKDGTADLNRAFIKELPLREQYALIQADRRAQLAKNRPVEKAEPKVEPPRTEQ